MRLRSLLYLLFFLIACNQASDNLYKPAVNYKADTGIRSRISTTQEEEMPVYEKAHPKAKLIMHEKFYFSHSNETSPFGNPDGRAAYLAFKHWRNTHTAHQPAIFLLRHLDRLTYPRFDLAATDFEKLRPYILQRELGSRLIAGTDAAVIAVAFGQLFMEGTVEKEFLVTTKTAIQRELIPELLAFWGEPYQSERAIQLRKMLRALDQVK